MGRPIPDSCAATNFWHHGHTLMSPTVSGVQFDECRHLRLHRLDERGEPFFEIGHGASIGHLSALDESHDRYQRLTTFNSDDGALIEDDLVAAIFVLGDDRPEPWLANLQSLHLCLDLALGGLIDEVQSARSGAGPIAYPPQSEVARQRNWIGGCSREGQVICVAQYLYLLRARTPQIRERFAIEERAEIGIQIASPRPKEERG